LNIFRPASRLEENLREQLANKKKDKHKLAKTHKAHSKESSSILITRLPSVFIGKSKAKKSASSEHLQTKLAAIEALQFENAKIEQFNKFRAEQKRLYYQYLR